jgi:hypothetical protein
LHARGLVDETTIVQNVTILCGNRGERGLVNNPQAIPSYNDISGDIAVASL